MVLSLRLGGMAPPHLTGQRKTGGTGPPFQVSPLKLTYLYRPVFCLRPECRQGRAHPPRVRMGQSDSLPPPCLVGAGPNGPLAPKPPRGRCSKPVLPPLPNALPPQAVQNTESQSSPELPNLFVHVGTAKVP